MAGLFSNLISVIETIRIIDIIDIISVAFILYYGVRLVRETRAMQLVKSIGVIFVINFIANLFHMVTLNFFLKKILDVGLIMLVVLFQPEIRRALERIGRSRIADLGRLGFSSFGNVEKTEKLIGILVEACEEIISKGDGALIVLERETRLGDVILTGTEIDAEASAPLIANIFFTNSPLHDGAMIIREGRIAAAGCYLPLSDSDELGRELGTRHRAALGVSEISDAITIVVSEERGSISVSENGQLEKELNSKNLERILTQKLLEPIVEEKKGFSSFWRFGGNKDEKK